MAVPPVRAASGLCMYEVKRTSRTAQRTFQLVPCFSLVPTAMAQLPKVGGQISVLKIQAKLK